MSQVEPLKPLPNGGFSVKLSKPISSHNGNVSEITLNPITARELMKYKKLPFSVSVKPDGSQTIEADYELIGHYITSLTAGTKAALDTLLIEQLSMQDFQNCMQAIARMVGDGRGGN